MPKANLMTKAMWEKLTPKNKGYVVYWQGNLPGSELKDVVCPYPLDSKERKEYAAGEFEAMMVAQDSEE